MDRDLYRVRLPPITATIHNHNCKSLRRSYLKERNQSSLRKRTMLRTITVAITREMRSLDKTKPKASGHPLLQKRLDLSIVEYAKKRSKPITLCISTSAIDVLRQELTLDDQRFMHLLWKLGLRQGVINLRYLPRSKKCVIR